MRASPDRAQTVSSLLCLNCITLMLSEIQISFTRHCQATQCQQLCQIDYKTHSASVTPQHRWSWVAPVSIQLLTGLYGGVCEAQQCHSGGVSISLKTYQFVQLGWSRAATGDLLVHYALYIVHSSVGTGLVNPATHGCQAPGTERVLWIYRFCTGCTSRLQIKGRANSRVWINQF